MSLRSDWTAAKARAKSHNNNTEVKFAKDLKLSEKLDKMEAAGKAYAKSNSGELGKAWAQAADNYFKLTLAAQQAALGYQQALERMPTINDLAKRDLDSHLTMQIMGRTTVILKDRDRLKARVEKLLKS